MPGRTSSRSRILFILSGESTGIPEAEAMALVRDADPGAKVQTPEGGLLIAETSADPRDIEARIAFSRRVGTLVEEGKLESQELALLRRGTYRVRVFGEQAERRSRERSTISSIAGKVGGRVSLENPDHEVTAYNGRTGAYLAITSPGSMKQGWARRRPRSRAFFHPSAIFPKLSRALVNLSGVRAGETFLDPFCGTGSLLIEASLVGAEPFGVDRARKMVRGARRNALKYEQPWLGLIRADTRSLPVARVDAMATDIPYGRASSAGGLESSEILASLVHAAGRIVSSGRKLVVMHPKSLEVAPIANLAGGFQIEQELEIYVHSKLTRTISVLRRGA